MAENALERWRTRFGFAVRQSSRVAWYAGHGAVMRRMVQRLEAQSPEPKRKVKPPKRPVPTMRRLLADVAALLSRDLANAERGHYPVPEDEDGALPKLIAQEPRLLPRRAGGGAPPAARPRPRDRRGGRRRRTGPTTTCRISTSSPAAG